MLVGPKSQILLDDTLSQIDNGLVKLILQLQLETYKPCPL